VRYGAIFLALIGLSSCSDDDGLVGKWIYTKAPYAPYTEDTLWISQSDSGLVCTTHRGKYITKHYLLNQNNSFVSKFMIGCFSYDLTYKIKPTVKKDSLLVSINSKQHKIDRPIILSYKKDLSEFH
jgi:hypothetical protein